MRGGFYAVITLIAVVAVVAIVRGDWLLAAIFAVMAVAFVRLQARVALTA